MQIGVLFFLSFFIGCNDNFFNFSPYLPVALPVKSSVIDYSSTFCLTKGPTRDSDIVSYQSLTKDHPTNRYFCADDSYTFNNDYFVAAALDEIKYCNALHNKVGSFLIKKCQAIQISQRYSDHLYIVTQDKIRAYSLSTALLLSHCQLPKILVETTDATTQPLKQDCSFPTMHSDAKPIIETSDSQKYILFIKPYHWVYDKDNGDITGIAFNAKPIDAITSDKTGNFIAIAQDQKIKIFTIADLHSPIYEIDFPLATKALLLASTYKTVVASTENWLYVWHYPQQQLLQKIHCASEPTNLKLSSHDKNQFKCKIGEQWFCMRFPAVERVTNDNADSNQMDCA
jgi:hypothetical protein